MSTNRYLEDVLEQPQALRDALSFYQSKEGLGLLKKGAWVLSRGSSHLWLTGMGASLFACFSARHLLDSGRFSYRVEETAYLAEHGYPNRRTAGGLVLVSQSGKTVEAVKLASQEGLDVPVVLLTCGEDGDLADSSDVVLPLTVEPDLSVAIKTYTASSMILQLLFAEVAGHDVQELFRLFGSCIDSMERYLESPAPIAEDVIDAVAQADEFYAVGRGPSLGSALETGLLFKETSKRGCEGMGSAQFRHGAVEVVASGVVCAIFSGAEDRTRGYHRNLAEEIVSYGGSVIEVGHGDLMLGVTDIRANVPKTSPTTLPLIEILPMQLLAAEVASRRGVQAGSFRNTQPIITTE